MQLLNSFFLLFFFFHPYLSLLFFFLLSSRVRSWGWGCVFRTWKAESHYYCRWSLHTRKICNKGCGERGYKKANKKEICTCDRFLIHPFCEITCNYPKAWKLISFVLTGARACIMRFLPANIATFVGYDKFSRGTARNFRSFCDLDGKIGTISTL